MPTLPRRPLDRRGFELALHRHEVDADLRIHAVKQYRQVPERLQHRRVGLFVREHVHDAQRVRLLIATHVHDHLVNDRQVRPLAEEDDRRAADTHDGAGNRASASRARVLYLGGVTSAQVIDSRVFRVLGRCRLLHERQDAAQDRDALEHREHHEGYRDEVQCKIHQHGRIAQQHAGTREERHQAQERVRVHAVHDGAVGIEYQHEAGRQQEVAPDDVVICAAQLVRLGQEAWQHPHGAGQHDEGVDTDPGSEPASQRRFCRLGQQCVFAGVDSVVTAEREHGEDANTERDIEDRHQGPHVAQRLSEHAWGLLLHIVRGGLETRDTQHGSAETEEHGGERVAVQHGPREVHLRVVCFHVVSENVRVLDAVHRARHHQDSQHDNVVQEDDEGHTGVLGNAHECQQSKGEQKRDSADHDRDVHLSVQVANSRCGGHDTRGHVRQDAEAGSHCSSALGRRVEQRVVGAAVHGDGGDHLLVDEPEEVEHGCHHEQRDGHELAGLGHHRRRRIQHASQDVVAADGGGRPLRQQLAWLV
ncbi:hypothetical protein ON010_g5965 [Phytophthora cinnamomi]|nr:hypothetical protein ON010_g5965 [Phytophthora cinnamomi]